MAGEVKHEWHGTVLTIVSDSGTSSMDLKGDTGKTGCRGPQGPAGIIVDENGQIDWNGYATEQWVNDQIAGVKNVDLSNYYTKTETLTLIDSMKEPDLTGYATETYVNNKIAAIPKPDLSKYYTKTEIEAKGYQTASQVEALINAALGVIENGAY